MIGKDSALCDFKAASIYAIYNIFFSQVQNFITNVISSFTFALGQMFHTDREKFDILYNVYETFYVTATFIIYTIMSVFLLPLIQIYTSGINDAEYSNTFLVLLFVVMNLISNAKIPVNGIIELAGEFDKTRRYAIWEMVINITVSVVAILYMGICGAILGTIAALLYRGIVTNCWFGKGKMPVLAKKCIKSWKKYCPDYEIVCHNEDNFDISENRLQAQLLKDSIQKCLKYNRNTTEHFFVKLAKK